VKISLPLATIVVSISAIFLLAVPALAQPNPRGAAPSQHSIDTVVIDVSKVFKEHIRFKQQLESMKKDVEAFEGYIQQERKRLTELATQLKAYNPGTPEYKRVEEQIARISSELQVQTQLKRNEFMDREAKVYYRTYEEMTKEVEEFCSRNGINLVLRYNSEPIDPTKRDSVLAGVNNSIIFQNKRDITGFIIERLNRGSMGTTPDTARGPHIPTVPR